MTDSTDMRRILLPNSLQLVCRDGSRRYFGDYHLVRVLLTLDIPLEARYFEDGEDHRSALRLLPDPVVYRRTAERMGVPSARVEEVRSLLVAELLRHAGQYLGAERFPVRYLQSELARARSGREGRSRGPGDWGA